MPVTNRLRKICSATANHHGRSKTDQFIAEGLRCCREAIDRRPDWLDSLLFSASFAKSSDAAQLTQLAANHKITPEIIADNDFAKLASTPTPQGVLAILNKPHVIPPEQLDDPFVLILDRISEPGNLGTILRTAWAIGLTQVWLVKGGADPFAPKVVRAGMGAQFVLTLHSFDSLAIAAQHFKSIGGQRLWVTLPKADISLFDESQFSFEKSALVIGNEANGVSDPSLGIPVTIPMPGHAESLNAAQATTVFLCEAVRRNLFKTLQYS
ncbi:MAG: RNA methyltransferase [Victivallales bacterium]|nr:RNA methyltransferase [Victivallales bacterium]